MIFSLPALEALREKARAATPGPWRWAWRKGDSDAPGSIFATPHEGHAYSVAICPRYGHKDFAANAEYITGLSPDVALALIEELIALLKLVSEGSPHDICVRFGHKVIDDQCMKPAHRFCVRCEMLETEIAEEGRP